MSETSTQGKSGRSPADRLRKRMADDARIVESVLKTAPIGDSAFNTALADLFDRFADRIAALHAGPVESSAATARQPSRNDAARARACDGKIRFASEYAASGRAGAISLNGGIAMHAYACEFCGGWHLGRRGGSGLRGGGKASKPVAVVLKLTADEVEAVAAAIEECLGDVAVLDGDARSWDAAHGALSKVAKVVAAFPDGEL